MKFRSYIGVILSLLIITLVLLHFIDPQRSVRRESRKMLVEDSSRIDHITIAGEHDTVSLSKMGGVWQLPGGDDVNPVAVENLFFAAERLQVEAVHSDLDEWADGSTRQVSFLSGNRLLLQYEILSRDGRLLLRLAGSERAFTVSLPGYKELDLTRVYSSSENHYRKHILIDLMPSEIRHITLEKRGHPEFRLSMDEEGQISCTLPQSDSLVPVELLDEEAIRMLFTYFTSIRYEEKAGDRMSLPGKEEMRERWLASLYLESTEGEKHSLRVYSIPGDNGEKTHMFRALVIHNDSPDALIINYIYLDVLMRGLSAYIGDNL